MSVLLDALKRAALEKKARDEPQATTGSQDLDADQELFWEEDEGIDDAQEMDVEAFEALADEPAPDTGRAGSVPSPEPVSQAPSQAQALKAQMLAAQQRRQQREPLPVTQPPEPDHSQIDESVEAASDSAAVTGMAEQLTEEPAAVDTQETDFFDPQVLEAGYAESIAEAASEIASENEREAPREPFAEPSVEPPVEFADGMSTLEPQPFGNDASVDEMPVPTATPEASDAINLTEALNPDQLAEQEEKETEKEKQDTALTTLVHEGHAINRRQKRRSRFLYVMLVITAVGGIGAYYFYLLGSNSLTLLLADRGQLQVPPPAAIADDVTADITAVDEGAGIDEDRQSLVPGATANPTNATNSTDPATAIAGAGSAPPVSEIAAEEPITQSNRINADNRLAVEQRADRPPSVNEIFRQLADAPPMPAPVTATQTDRLVDSRHDNASLASTPPQAETERVQIYHRAIPTRLSDLVGGGYAAYQRGDLDGAESLYNEALRLDSQNRDAMLGVAAVAAARGDSRLAFMMYQRRLNVDPTDTYARAGILGLSNLELIDPADIDSLLQVSPDAAHLHFVKGAIYAARAQWRQAQSAFFDAYQWDRRNADYVYNLAVSLDHLGQAESASGYYKEALRLGDGGKVGFSEDSARRRIAELGAKQ